ncbi:rod shape-determining protein MreC [Pseudonocardia sp. TMWB2A]|uniref:rod shape-determining protein MreC n=1 Tax=Pseudonocardia sp. TMWB2A TaxID=687430 RepID=UPI00307DBDBB
MAAPSPRRPGYSRKAQYGLFAAYVIAVAGAVAGLLLVLISAFDPTGFAALRGLAREITAPVSRTSSSVVGSIGSADENISAYFRAGSQNKELRRQLDTAHNKIIEAKALVDENARLRALLKLRDESSDAVTVGRLITSTASSSRRFATLDGGALHGVRSGQPVRAPEGLVGRVLEVGPSTARVLLLTDAESVIPVRRASDGLPATITGLGDGTVQIQLLQTSLSNIKAGDLFVTSGSGGMYRPNIPVALALRKGTDNAIGRPIADPAKVDVIMVQQAYQADIKPPPTAEEMAAEAEKRIAAEKARARAAEKGQ